MKPRQIKLTYLLCIRPYINIVRSNYYQFLFSTALGAMMFVIMLFFSRLGVVKFIADGFDSGAIVKLIGLWYGYSILLGIVTKFPLPDHLWMLCETVPHRIRCIFAYSVLWNILNIQSTISRCIILAGACFGLGITMTRVSQICGLYVACSIIASCMRMTFQVGIFSKMRMKYFIISLVVWALLAASSIYYKDLPGWLLAFLPQSLLITVLRDANIPVWICFSAMLIYIIAMCSCIAITLNKIPRVRFFESMTEYRGIQMMRFLRNVAPAWLKRTCTVSCIHSAFHNLTLHGAIHTIYDAIMLRGLFAEVFLLMLIGVTIRQPKSHIPLLFLCMFISLPVLRCAMSSARALIKTAWLIRISHYQFKKAWAAYCIGAFITGSLITIPVVLSTIMINSGSDLRIREVIAFCVWAIGSLLPMSAILGIWFQIVFFESDALTSHIPYLFRHLLIGLIYICCVILPGLIGITFASTPLIGCFSIHVFLGNVLFNMFIGSWLLSNTLKRLNPAFEYAGRGG